MVMTFIFRANNSHGFHITFVRTALNSFAGAGLTSGFSTGVSSIIAALLLDTNLLMANDYKIQMVSSIFVILAAAAFGKGDVPIGHQWYVC